MKTGSKLPNSMIDLTTGNIEIAQKAYEHFNPRKQFVVVPGEMDLMVISEDKMRTDS